MTEREVKATTLASLGIPPVKNRSRVVVERRSSRGTIYQLELVRCGKPRCSRCKLRATHGPYWYRYRWSVARKRLVSKYVGKELKP